MINLIKQQRIFLIISALYLIAGLLGFFVLEKGDVVIWLNERHTLFGDWWFKGMTLLGDGIAIVVVATLFLGINRFQGLLITSSAIITSLVSQFLKRVVFEWPRPMKYLGDEFYASVADVHVHGNLSFPSGHTTGAFTMLFAISIFSKNSWVQGLAAFFAIMTGISRMYLYQHFLEDTLAGATIAIVLTLCVYHFFFQRLGWEEKLDKPLFSK